MSRTVRTRVLAEAADVLSDQLRSQLRRLAQVLEPHVAGLDRRFLAELRKLRFDRRQRTALAAITPGAAARILNKEGPEKALAEFLEQVQYNGLRLAKLNMPPSAVAEALERFGVLATKVLHKLDPAEEANLQWVRQQLHFCVVLTLNNAYYQVREAETAAFFDLVRIEQESKSLEEMLRGFLASLAQYCRADQARFYLLNEEVSTWVLEATVGGAQDPVVVEASGKSELLRPWCAAGRSANGAVLAKSWKNRFATVWSVPMTAGNRAAGVIQFAFERPYEWFPRERELLEAAAERCLRAAEKTRLVEDLAAREEEVRRLAAHMLQVEEMERRRISRELHDEAGQSMLCIRLQLEMLEGTVPDGQQELKSKLRQVRESTERTIVDIRRLIAALSPAVLEQLGLEAALRQLVKRFQELHPAKVRTQMHHLDRLPKRLNIIAYRLVQECFNNIAKHSEATAVNLFVGSADGRLRLTVEDNGVGFVVEDALARRESFGLAGMMERVALLGGKVEVVSCPAVRAKPAAGKAAAEGPRKAIALESRRVMGRGKRSKPGTSIEIELPIPPG